MPETLLRIRWPDGAATECYSPSRAIAEFLRPGATYPRDEFVRRSREGLTAASERVRARYGFACSRAAAQLAALEAQAARYEATDMILVEAVHGSGP